MAILGYILLAFYAVLSIWLMLVWKEQSKIYDEAQAELKRLQQQDLIGDTNEILLYEDLCAVQSGILQKGNFRGPLLER